MKRSRATLTCVNDRADPRVLHLLREACDTRDVTYAEVDARSFDYEPARQLARGDLLYRPATTLTAIRVEQFLFAPGVATFYGDGDDRLFFVSTSQPLHFERAGIPVPATIHCGSRDRALLDGWAKRLGGYPILAKMGGQGGAGIVLLESPAALYSFVDYVVELGRHPALTAYIRDAVLWRVVVVGAQAVAAYKRSVKDGDVRATDTNDDSVFTADPPPALAALAVKAVAVTHVETGGVDILETADGCYVLESKFPCFFPVATIEGGIDVAGPMVEYLLRKAGR
jgi:hypothetical protein